MSIELASLKERRKVDRLPCLVQWEDGLESLKLYGSKVLKCIIIEPVDSISTDGLDWP